MSKTVIMSMYGNKEIPRDEYKWAIRSLRDGCLMYPEHLVSVPRIEWPSATARMTQPIIGVARSRTFCCQFYDLPNGIVRMSVNRSEVELVNNICQWKQGITWDDLQRLKMEAGYGDRMAVEVYPPDDDVVNVANMRHLWVLPKGETLPFAWTKENA